MGSPSLLDVRDPPPKDVLSSTSPKPSGCDRCGGVFSHLTDELAYFGGDRTCHTCGAESHWEHRADQNWLAVNTRPEAEYQVVRKRGRPRVVVFPERKFGSSPLTGGKWFKVGKGEGRHVYAIPAAPKTDRLRYRVVQVPPMDDPADRVFDVDGTLIDVGELFDHRRKTVYDLRAVAPRVRTFYVVDALMRSRTAFRDPVVERLEGFRGWREDVVGPDDPHVSYGRKSGFWFRRDGTPLESHAELGNPTTGDFLREDGWIIEKAGTTGRPPGRKSQGIHVRLVALDLVTGISTTVRLKITADGTLVTPRSEWKRAVNRIVAQVPDSVSAETAGEIFGLGERRVQQIRKISPNPPKGGQDD
jgi:hypothetical protein